MAAPVSSYYEKYLFWKVAVQKKSYFKKKLRKSKEFARKISAAEFRYSQTIFLRSTVTLFQSNLDEKITSKK